MASSSSNQTPISPIKLSKPELTISVPAINDQPIELDGTSISPEELRLARRGSKAEALEAQDAGKGLSESRAERERRSELMRERKADPAVLVDIPKAPAPDELERAGADRDDGEGKNAGKA